MAGLRKEKMSQLHTIKNLKPLLIESDPLISDSLSLAFEVSGAYLFTAPTVETGLTMMDNIHFDIHICDLRFPKTNCLEFFRKASVRNSKALNVVIGSSWNENLIREALAAGVQHFIQKPISVEALIQSLPLWVKARQKSFHRIKPRLYHTEIANFEQIQKLPKTTDHDYARRMMGPRERDQSALSRRYKII